MSRQLKSLLISTFVTAVLIAGLGLFVWFWVVPRVSELPIFNTLGPNRTVVDFHTHFNLDPDIPQIVLDGQRIRNIPPPIVERRGAYIFLHVDFMRSYIDPFLFWDDGAGVLFASTRYEILEFTPGSRRFLINNETRQLQTPIRRTDGEIFLPADLIQSLYPVTVEFFAEYNMVVLTSLDVPQKTGRVAVSRANVRYWGDDRAPVTARLERGTEVLIFSNDDFDENYIRVRTPLGLLGYALRSDLEDFAQSDVVINQAPLVSSGWIQNLVHHPPSGHGGGAVNMVWEVVYHPDANVNLMAVPFHPGLTVVSPTWFRIDPAGTHINSVASRAYVDRAHEQGVYVWPLIFDVDADRAGLFLMNRSARRHGINQIVNYVDLLNLDGINIDFEHLRPAYGPYKIQFLRELAIPLRERGVVLSAAVKVPIPETMFYRRDLIGLTVDFVQVMTYDQHWATSPVAGPNAGLNWVQWGINNMLREVPADRLIMGLPFYNRIWRVVQRDDSVTQQARGMAYTRNLFEQNGVNWVWDPYIGSYYGYFSALEAGEIVIYRVWLEDARSIRSKMQLFIAYELAGVASWRRGFEVPEVWDVIEFYLGR